MSNNVIINLSRQGKRRLDINLKLSYTTHTDEVKKIIENVIRSTNDILNEPVARVGVADMEFDRYTIGIQVWINAHGFEDAKFILQERLMNDLKNAGIFSITK